MNPVLIDPGVVSLIQSTFLDNINGAFSTVAGYAFTLLYLFAALELTISGLAWAVQRDIGWDKLFFKIIRIGLIFFVIQNYTWLLRTIVNSFAKIAGIVVSNGAVAQYVFNPAKIWQYGYDVGVHLLQLAAANTNGFSLPIIQIILGMGILLVFGLLGIQMIVQMISFYLVSLGTLIFLPFGAFAGGSNMLDKAMQAVLKAGIRLMSLIIIIGIAITVWNGFEFNDLVTTSDFNINQPLGLFFTALLFLCLALYLPKVVSEAVGEFRGSLLSQGGAQAVTVGRESVSVFADTGSGGGLSNLQAATTISAGMAGSSGSGSEGQSSTAAAASISTTSSGGGMQSSGTIESKGNKNNLSQASSLSKGVSENTVKRIKEVVLQAMKEKPGKS